MMKIPQKDEPMDMSKARDDLLDLDRKLSEIGIKYCVVAGTLLGCMRHGGFIPWDSDIDILVNQIDVNETLLQHVFLKDYRMEFVYSGEEFPFFTRLKRNVKIDLWPWRFDHGKVKTLISLSEANKYLPFKMAKFEDFEVPIPQDPMWVLDYNYGKNWMNRVVKSTEEGRTVHTAVSLSDEKFMEPRLSSKLFGIRYN